SGKPPGTGLPVLVCDFRARGPVVVVAASRALERPHRRNPDRANVCTSFLLGHICVFHTLRVAAELLPVADPAGGGPAGWAAPGHTDRRIFAGRSSPDPTRVGGDRGNGRVAGIAVGTRVVVRVMDRLAAGAGAAVGGAGRGCVCRRSHA